ncbi:MAG: ECF transporter S component [candidate division KSB1 bacterium]|nr:ECF transporter S component [candidate division KSB1 bacterium]
MPEPQQNPRPPDPRKRRSDRYRQLALGAIVTAAGVLLPILFHAAGVGPVFLPMFLPLAVGSFALRPWVAVAVGVFTPLLSSFVTGMPSLMPPVAPVLSVELGVFAGLIALLYRLGIQPTLALLLAFAVNRLLLLLIALAVAPALGLPSHWTGLAAVAYGLPGIVLMVVLVPALLPRLSRFLEV